MNIDTRPILESITMAQAVELYVNEPIKKHFICCPFHAEKTPSLRIYDNSFYCFGCGVGGDVIRFVQHYFSIDFSAALMRLDYDFHLGLNLGQKLTRRQRHKMRQQARERQRQAQALRDEQDAADALYWALWDEWIRLDKNRMNYKPTDPSAPLHPLFVEAITKIEYQEYLIDQLT